MGKKILVAGSTGYLGQFVIKGLNRQGYWIRALCRNDPKIDPVRRYVDDVFKKIGLQKILAVLKV